MSVLKHSKRMNHPPQIEATVANRNLNGGYNSRLLVTL
ncbi:MAG: hypothetical protein ACI9RY_001651, partial [Reinekea sp.]